MIVRSITATAAGLSALIAVAAFSTAPALAGASHARHRHALRHRADRRVAPLYGYGYGYSSRTIAPVNPAYGYSEAPYDPTYRGPGWEVFALQHRVEQNARVLHEIAPDAKISASGIVVGGD